MGKRTLLWLSVILIIAGVLRFRHLTTTPPGLFPDEAVDGNNALQALRSGDFKVFYTANNGEEGLFANVEAIVLAASGVQEPWTLRLPSAIFGMLTVLGMFLLARQLFGRDSIALLAAFFLATSFWHVNFSRIGFRAIMAPCFLVWAIYFLVSSLAASRCSGTAWRAILAGTLFGLGCYSYISYRVTPLLVLLMIPFFWREQKFRRTLALSGAVAFLIALPLGIHFFRNPTDFFRRSSEVSVFSSAAPVNAILGNAVKTAGMLDVHGDDNWRHNIAGRPELYWPVGIAFWIGIAVGLAVLFRRNGSDKDRAAHFRERVVYLFCIAWIALAALPAVFSNEGMPHALRAILMIPPIMLLAAVGGVWIHDQAMKQFPAVDLS